MSNYCSKLKLLNSHKHHHPQTELEKYTSVPEVVLRKNKLNKIRIKHIHILLSHTQTHTRKHCATINPFDNGLVKPTASENQACTEPFVAMGLLHRVAGITLPSSNTILTLKWVLYVLLGVHIHSAYDHML